MNIEIIKTIQDKFNCIEMYNNSTQTLLGLTI